MIALGETTPYWALSLAFWLHMLATVAWIGGLVAVVILVLPAAKKTLEPETYANFLGQLQRRLDPLGWLSLAVLFATGLFQISANPNYEGLLNISNRWAAWMLLKRIPDLGYSACPPPHSDETGKRSGRSRCSAASEKGDLIAAYQSCPGRFDPWSHSPGACSVDQDFSLRFGRFEEDIRLTWIIMIKVSLRKFTAQCVV